MSVGINQPIQPQPFIEITEVPQQQKPISTGGLDNHTIVITEERGHTDTNTQLVSSQVLGNGGTSTLREVSDLHVSVDRLVDERMEQISQGHFRGSVLVDDELDRLNGYESDYESDTDYQSLSSDNEDHGRLLDPEDADELPFRFVDPNAVQNRDQLEGNGNRLDGGAGQGEGVENREGERQVEGGPRRVEGEVEMGLELADRFRVGENQVNDIGQRQDINSDRTIPPQKILREAIAKAKGQPGFENASVKVKSSLDQELRSDNPNFKVETEVNMHGVLLYKVSVDFNVEVKNENGEVITMTLNRVFYSNAANEKEALLAIYNVAKGVKQQATADNISDNALEQKLFTVTYSRDPQSKSIIGVRSVVGDRDVDATPRSSGKTTFGRDIDAQGQVRLRRAGQGELEQGQALSKQARLLRSNIEFTDVPILDRLKRKKTEHKSYIDSQAYQANNLNEEFSLLKEQLLKDDLLKWIATNKKTFNTQVDNILSGKANPRDLPLSEKMQEYLSLRQEYVKVQPLVEEFKINEAMSEGLKEIREKLKADKPLTPEDLAFIKGAKNKMGVDLESPTDLTALSALISGVEVKQNALRQQVGSQNPAGKLAELEGAYAEARVAALKEHQGLFANLGRMQDIQNELMDRKSKLEELREGIKNVADMPRPEAQMKMALIDEALGKIEAQIKDNAKVLNVESHLGKLFDQEIVIPPSVQRTGVSSDPDIVGQDAPA